MPATVAYTYLGLNTPVRADYEDPDVRWDLITGSSPNPYAGLDRFGRTIDCRWEKYSSTAADLARLKYGYNRASSRQWRDDTVGTGFDEFYTYDAVQRLIDMERGTLTGGPPPTGITSPTLGQEWDLDPTGNWSGFEQTLSGAVTQTRTSNMDNEITNITNSVGSSWVTPVYNNAGAITLMPSAGATPTPARSGIYDAWDRTTRIAGGVTGTGDYRYDGLNRRTTKATLSPNETRHFYYSDQWQVLEERVGSSTAAERQHVWGLRYVDDLALRDRDTNGDGSLDERLYSMQDDNWNVVAICNPSAVVQERYAYTPYGMIQFLNASFAAISASAFAWRYLFTGRERDTESTLQYNRNRYYHARLGTWTTRDPAGYEAGDVNLYRYVGNNPATFCDWAGKKAFRYWVFDIRARGNEDVNKRIGDLTLTLNVDTSSCKGDCDGACRGRVLMSLFFDWKPLTSHPEQTPSNTGRYWISDGTRREDVVLRSNDHLFARFPIVEARKPSTVSTPCSGFTLRIPLVVDGINEERFPHRPVSLYTIDVDVVVQSCGVVQDENVRLGLSTQLINSRVRPPERV